MSTLFEMVAFVLSNIFSYWDVKRQRPAAVKGVVEMSSNELPNAIYF